MVERKMGRLMLESGELAQQLGFPLGTWVLGIRQVQDPVSYEIVVSGTELQFADPVQLAEWERHLSEPELGRSAHPPRVVAPKR